MGPSWRQKSQSKPTECNQSSMGSEIYSLIGWKWLKDCNQNNAQQTANASIEENQSLHIHQQQYTHAKNMHRTKYRPCPHSGRARSVLHTSRLSLALVCQILATFPCGSRTVSEGRTYRKPWETCTLPRVWIECPSAEIVHHQKI